MIASEKRLWDHHGYYTVVRLSEPPEGGRLPNPCASPSRVLAVLVDDIQKLDSPPDKETVLNVQHYAKETMLQPKVKLDPTGRFYESREYCVYDIWVPVNLE